MNLTLVRPDGDGYAFSDLLRAESARFCANKRAEKDSQCAAHYKKLFELRPNETKAGGLCRCPYGLVSTHPICVGSFKIIITGFWVDDIGDESLSSDVKGGAKISLDQLDSLLPALSQLIENTCAAESMMLEAAVHDVRHLNRSIVTNAELLLEHEGFGPRDSWDMTLLSRNDTAKRALTIFAASQDLALAISMHELVRDPAAARQNIEAVAIHKIFHKQYKICVERLNKKRMTLNIQNTIASLRLTRSFQLIPKILLDNAIKYSDRNSAIDVRFYEGRGFFNIECTNTGPVIRDDEVGRVFERGFRGANRYGSEGHGIGLWLAKIIVDANDGMISMSVRETGKDISGRRVGVSAIKITLVA